MQGRCGNGDLPNASYVGCYGQVLLGGNKLWDGGMVYIWWGDEVKESLHFEEGLVFRCRNAAKVGACCERETINLTQSI